jgi:hypothetical protein
VLLLQAQLDAERSFQSSVLDTVYWALGGVFFLVGLLLGIGWFANFKVYERDKEALKSTLEGLASKLGADLMERHSHLATSLEKTIQVQTSERGKAVERTIMSSVSSVEDRLTRLEIDLRTKAMQGNKSPNLALTDALSLLETCAKRAIDEVPDIVHFMLKTIDLGGKLTANEITRVNAVLDILPAHYKTLVDKLRAKMVASDIF